VAIGRLSGKLGDWSPKETHRRTRLSHLLRRQQRSPELFAGLPVHNLEEFRLDDPLPSPAQQLDDLVLWIGERQPSPAESIPFDPREIEAWIGARIIPNASSAGLSWLLRQQEAQIWIDQSEFTLSTQRLKLSMAGWMRYEELKRHKVDSRKAFMAMKFDKPDVEEAYRKCFQPAAQRAGFKLLILPDQQGAGIIDDQMRVAIRTARFVVSDLTHSSPGAYWEAGFAEGLGRPVFYTCCKEKWVDEKTHFDVNHLATVIWELDDLSKAEKTLTFLIRNTLPDAAVMDHDM